MGPRFVLLRVAKDWHLTPGQFRALPYDEQIEMMAEYYATAEMNNKDEYEMEKKAKAKQAQAQARRK